MKFNKTLKNLIAMQIRNNNNIPALIGEPAIGKTKFTKDIADELGAKYFILNVNELSSKEDLSGPRVIEENGHYVQKFFPHHDIMQAIDYATAHDDELVVLVLDEINRSGPDVTSATLSIPTSRRIGSYDIPENMRFIVTGNDKGNITALDDASISRFTIWKVEPDAETFLDVMKAKNQEHPWVTKILFENPELIFCRNQTADDDSMLLDEDQMEQLTGPRTLEGLINMLNVVTEDNQKPEKMFELFGEVVTTRGEETTIGRELIESHIGRTPFADKLTEIILTEMDQSVHRKTSVYTSSIKRPDAIMDQILDSNNVADIENILSSLDQATQMDVALYMLMETNLVAQRKLSHVNLVFSALSDGFDDIHKKEMAKILNDNAFVDSNLRHALKTNSKASSDLKTLAEAFGIL